MTLRKIYYLHEIGGKKTQEDYLWPPPGVATPADKIFIVCDGVGGAEHGELASKMIAEFAGAYLLNAPADSLSQEMINDMLGKAQEKLVAHARHYALNPDMATTFSLLVLQHQKAFIAWCGDTRAYHIRNGVIQYKTSDHSLVNSLVKNGSITEEEAAVHPQRNIILKAIKADLSPIEADAVWIDDVQDGDFFVLCTDGVMENIKDTILTTLLASENFSQNGIIDLFQKYCYGKTRDNYSMYLLQTGKPVTTKKSSSARKTGWAIATILLLAFAGLVYRFYPQQKNISRDITPLPAYAEQDSATSVLKDEPTDTVEEIPEVEIIKAPLKPKEPGKQEMPKTSIIKKIDSPVTKTKKMLTPIDTTTIKN